MADWSGAYAWQRPSRSAPPPPADAEDNEDGPAWEQEEKEEDKQPTKREAGDALAEYLLELKHKGVISARQLCTISYWASLAGADGPVNEFSFRLQAPTGHYARHLDSVLGTRQEDERLYTMRVPGYVKASASRETIDLVCCPHHESLAEEVVHDPAILEKTMQACANKQLPPPPPGTLTTLSPEALQQGVWSFRTPSTWTLLLTTLWTVS